MVTTQEIVEEVTALDDSQKEYLRDAAKNDLYVLGKGILGYPDVNPRTHGAYCRFYDGQRREANWRRKLGLMPRGHLKSTLATITDSIRIVLQDPENHRVLIANETATTAQKFLSDIKGHWQKNELLRSLFPELVPSRFSGAGVTWSAEKASLERSKVVKEPHWQAIGVGGAITGSHFTHIKCDDLIGFEAGRSQAKMEFAIAWNDNIESLLENQHHDVIDWIGTRWKGNDLYNNIMQKYGERLKVFTRQAVEDGSIIFPELHTWEEYTHLMQNSPLVWAAQYENNPRAAGLQDFDINQVRYFKFSLDGTEILGNPGQRNQVIWKLPQLDIVILVDPNSGSATAPDTAAILVVGLSPNDEVFVLDTWSARPSSSEFVDKIYEVAQRWRPRAVGIEKAGQQSTQHYFEKKAAEADFYLRVEPLTPKNRNKEQRIRDNLDGIIKSGRLYTLASQTALREQIENFPNIDIWDELDALAYGPEIWRKPFRAQDVKEARKNIKMVLMKRNPLTGY